MKVVLSEHSKYIGKTESDIIFGKQITKYHSTTKYGEGAKPSVAWCSSFVNWAMIEAGYKGTNSWAAFSWKKWGKEVKEPIYGAIAICDFSHVGFVVGTRSNKNRIVIIGGNQDGQIGKHGVDGDEGITYTSVDKKHILKYVIPKDYKGSEDDKKLKIINVNAEASRKSTR